MPQPFRHRRHAGVALATLCAIGLLAPAAAAQGQPFNDSRVSIGLIGTPTQTFLGVGSASGTISGATACRVGEGPARYSAEASGSASARTGRLTFSLRGGGIAGRFGETCTPGARDTITTRIAGRFAVAGPLGVPVTVPQPVSFTAQFNGSSRTRNTELLRSTDFRDQIEARFEGVFNVGANRPGTPANFAPDRMNFRYDTGLRIVPHPTIRGLGVEELFDPTLQLTQPVQSSMDRNPLMVTARTSSYANFVTLGVRTTYDLLLLPGDVIDFDHLFRGSVRAGIASGPAVFATNSGSLFLDLPEGWSIVPLSGGEDMLSAMSPLPAFGPPDDDGGVGVIPLPAGLPLLLGALAMLGLLRRGLTSGAGARPAAA